MTDKMPTGVEMNGKQLRIWFIFNGQRCREPLEGISKVNKAAIAYADNKRRTILAEIKEGRFDYAAHFPNSPRAAMFTGTGGPSLKRTVKEGIDRWLEVQRALKASSTFVNYVSKAVHVEKKFGKRRIVDISKSDIELFQVQLLKQGLAPKTVNDIFTVVRGVWADAFGDGILKANPLDRISNVGSDVDLEHADPFSRTEIELIGKADPIRRNDARMIEFNCWAGLSLSELIALAVEDVDLEAGTVHVRRALVVGEFKVPKERSRIRTVELVDPALTLMREIVAAANNAPSIEIKVIQRDNITAKKQNVRFLFRSSTSGLLWNGKTLSNWFTCHLKKAEVRHRGANQCRHTFASQMLSSYVPVEWVARQLGHADTTMIRKHYGRWIQSDTKSMAGLVSQMLGFRRHESSKNTTTAELPSNE
ncbi:Arm DNA-binding domain-containing protein [Pseudomonas laurylsulfatiphila]|uniref:Arm DNA-binding domain-containing protein n=1 Tax=Pseudomonas laurylsulfatiphila TaxID=2011015 RepID=UPI003D21AB32